jgi:hypothetical protein
MLVSTRRRPDWPPFFVSRFCLQLDALSRRKAGVKRLGKRRYLKTDVPFCANDRLPHRHTISLTLSNATTTIRLVGPKRVC